MNAFRHLASLTLAIALAACGMGEMTFEDDAFEDNLEALSSPGRFETFVGRDGQFYFHLRAANGERVLGSEGYSTLSSARNGIASVKTNGGSAGRYQRRQASDGSWYFVLKASNGQVIGVSQMYATAYNADRAIASVSQVILATVAQEAALAAPPRFEVFQGIDSKYYFHLRANNGEIVLQSQGYTARSGATSGMSSVQTNGALTARYQVRPAADGQHYFVLKAGNGWIVGRGETYETQAGAERGVATCVELLSGSVQR